MFFCYFVRFYCKIRDMIGHVIKIISDFYYADTEIGLIECKLREILKKKFESVIVGDFVELDALTPDSTQAFISKVFPRKNFISRPKVANISKAIIVSALKNPDFDFEQLNRYIALCEYHKITPVLCFNKCDLNKDEALIEEIKNIYEPLGYKLFFTSATLHIGTEPLSEFMKDNVCILCGASGVGKTTIINYLTEGIHNLATKNVSEKTKRGVHTTRHCQIYKIDKNSSIVDTPGFSNVKFNFLLPTDVKKLFKEIDELSECKYKDCIHVHETGCNVLENMDKVAKSRYESYKKFVEEAKEFKQKIKDQGTKVESTSKFNKGVTMAKLSENKRTASRRLVKQNTGNEANADE